MTFAEARLTDGTFCLKTPGAGTRGIVVLAPLPGFTPAVRGLLENLASRYDIGIVAPELVSDSEYDIETRMGLVRDLDDDRIFETLRLAAAATDAERVDLMGFCTGGMYALKASSLNPFTKIVAFYGMVTVPPYWQGAGQREPLDYLASADPGRVFVVQGGQDEFVPDADLAELRQAPVELAFYAKAEHAFAHDATRGSYRRDDADDAWRRVLRFLDLASGAAQSPVAHL